MAAGDLSDALVINVRRLLGDLGGLTWEDADVYAALAEGQRQLATRLPDNALAALSFVVSASLTAALTYYSLPTGFMRESLVKYKGIVATRWPLQEIDSLDGSLPDRGEDRPYYFVWANRVYFEVGTVTQAGAEAYEVWYIKEPAAISTTVDPVLGKEFYPVLETFAVARCLEANDDMAGAKLWGSLSDSQFAVIAARYGGRPAPEDAPKDIERAN